MMDPDAPSPPPYSPTASTAGYQSVMTSFPENDSRSTQPLHPPVPLLVGAAVALLASVALVPAGGFADWEHLAGWLAASVVAVGFVASYTSQDLRRRERSNYSPNRRLDTLRWVLAIAAIVLCCVHAWTLAWSLAAR